MNIYNQKFVTSISSYRRNDPGTTDIENFLITLNKQFFTPRKMKLLKANIPFSWDNIVLNFNDTFTIWLPNTGGTPYVVTVPQANYDQPQFIAAILQAIIASLIPSPNSYTLTFDVSTIRYTFVGPGPFVLDFSASNAMSVELGFPNSYITPSASDHTSTIVSKLNKDFEILVCSSNISGIDSGVVDDYSNANSDNILCIVPINSQYGGVIRYENYSGNYGYFNINQSEFFNNGILNFYLRFGTGFPLLPESTINPITNPGTSLNKSDWTMEIEFTL